MPEWVVGPNDAGVRLDKFLAAPDRAGSRGKAADALARGKVLLNGVEAGLSAAAQRLAAGDAIRLWIDRPGSARRKPPHALGELRIVYEDDALWVVDKPAGLLVVPLARRADADSVSALLERHIRSRRQRPLVVHRIDRDTSGLVMFAKDPRAQDELKAQLRRREPERVYLAVVHGHPEPAAATWRDHMAWDDEALEQRGSRAGHPQAREAISHYRVVERLRGAALVEVRLHTGKRNQIRLQAALHGHALVGERRYLGDHPPATPIEFPRQALHAFRLGFRHPRHGRPLEFEAPLPADLRELLRRLR